MAILTGIAVGVTGIFFARAGFEPVGRILRAAKELLPSQAALGYAATVAAGAALAVVLVSFQKMVERRMALLTYPGVANQGG